MKDEIDSGRPFVWSTSGADSGHSVPAWGYRDDNYIIIYDTWWPPGREDWYFKYYLGNSSDPVTYVQVEGIYPGGGFYNADVSLDDPNGGEALIANHPYTIWWYQWGTAISYVDLLYSTDGGVNWNGITGFPSVAGWNSYIWQVPNLSSTTSTARIKVAAYLSNIYMSGDGSFDNFTITKPTCSSLTYPIGKWQRVWSIKSNSYCLGDGPDETNQQFDTDWGTGEVAHGRNDDIAFTSSRAINLSAGNYRIKVGSDDGVKLWVDGVLKLDRWVDRGYTTDFVDLNLTAGYHNFRLDFYENGGGARVSFAIEQLPDLIVQGIATDPASPAPGQVVNVTVTVKNQGQAAAGAFFIDVYKNSSTAPSPGSYGDFYCSQSGLAAGATATCLGTVSYETPGTYKMWAQVDTDQGIYESNENNNILGPQNIVVQNYTLNVTKAGNGSGTVTSNPAGINCGADCTENYNYNTAVTLTAAAATGSYFTGWSGDADCADGVVTMAASKTCTATFRLFTLTVIKTGRGSGTVTSTPAGINCGADCTENYNYNTAVTLTAAAATGSHFYGWSGDADCADGVVTMTAEKTCTADFGPISYALNVTRNGSGSGTVTSTPAGINCGADCAQYYEYNTSVTLTAAAVTGSTFTGWSGDADCADGAVTMAAAKTCTATFTPVQYALNVTKAGTGSGTVTSTPAGISCGTDCTENYNYNTSVTLAAAAATGSTFTGWSGDADCADGVVTMAAAKTCTATFNTATPSDLLITAVTGPTTAIPGTLITIGDTTKNQGAGTAAASKTKFYLSTNNTYSADDQYLGERSITALPTGTSDTGTISVTAPDTCTVGKVTFYIIARSDANNEVVETNENNNNKAKSINIGPDLIISTITTSPLTSGAGKTITVTDTIKNQGGCQATVNTTTKFYLSSNSTWDAGDTYLAERPAPALSPSGTDTVSTPVIIPAGTATGASWYIIARADANAVVLETSETNNNKSKSIKIGPDMIVSLITAPTSAARGAAITVNDTTKNSGGGDAGASTTRLYLSANTTYDAGDSYLGERAAPALNAGASSTPAVGMSVSIPSGITTGSYNIIALSDADNTVAETSETNNTKYKAITINP